MALNPYLDRLGAAPKNSHGKSYEKKGAASLAARLTPASGAMASAKGDMVKKNKGRQSHLIESKSTTSLSMPIKLEWLVKISEEALAKGMQPALLIAFVTPSGSPKPHCDSEWVAIPKHVYQELISDA